MFGGNNVGISGKHPNNIKAFPLPIIGEVGNFIDPRVRGAQQFPQSENPGTGKLPEYNYGLGPQHTITPMTRKQNDYTHLSWVQKTEYQYIVQTKILNKQSLYKQ